MEIENAYYDTKGKPADAYGWIHKITVKYDKNDTPTERKVFDVAGTQRLHQQFIDGEWIEVRNWQKEVRDYFENELPYDFGEDFANIVMYSYNIKKSKVEILMKTPMSKYAMSNENIEGYIGLSEFVLQFVKGELDLPKNVKLTYILEDSKDRELSRSK